MGYFNRGGRDNRGGGRGGGFGRNDAPREMFKTVCSNCGKECEVPFKPTSGKPVYCSDCFEKMGGRNSDGPRNDKQSLPFQGRSERRERPSFDRHQTSTPRVDYGQQFESLNKKMDKIIELLTPKDEIKMIEIETPKKIKKSKKVVDEGKSE